VSGHGPDGIAPVARPKCFDDGPVFGDAIPDRPANQQHLVVEAPKRFREEHVARPVRNRPVQSEVVSRTFHGVFIRPGVRLVKEVEVLGR
jgi:hypothetical protein